MMEHSGQSLGYVFSPPAQADWPGHRQLQIILRAAPTEAHYDPESVSFLTASGSGGADLLTVHHPWPRAESHRICPGRVVLRDRHGKTVQAFTFGGELRIEPEDALTQCTLRSRVPILALLREDSVSTALAMEVEALLATRRAVWDMRQLPAAFEERLATADPVDVYLTCLQAVSKQLSHLPHLESAATHHLAHFVMAEIHGDAHSWQASNAPSLEELL